MSVTICRVLNSTIVELRLANSHVYFAFIDGVPLSAYMYVEEGVLSMDAYYHRISVKGTIVYMTGNETDNSFEMPPELVSAFIEVGFVNKSAGGEPMAIEGSN